MESTSCKRARDDACDTKFTHVAVIDNPDLGVMFVGVRGDPTPDQRRILCAASTAAWEEEGIQAAVILGLEHPAEWKEHLEGGEASDMTVAIARSAVAAEVHIIPAERRAALTRTTLPDYPVVMCFFAWGPGDLPLDFPLDFSVRTSQPAPREESTPPADPGALEDLTQRTRTPSEADE